MCNNDCFVYLLLIDFLALLNMRKETIAKNIEKDLNEKNSAEGNTEKKEVDVDSVDWLYGTYKLKGDDTIYHRNEENENSEDKGN